MPRGTGRTDEALWQKIVARVKRSACCGTAAGQWSARKAQRAGHLYRAAGGGYTGQRTRAQRSLRSWSRARWQTRSGRPSSVTGERYLPRAVLAALSPAEYRRTSAAKRRAMARGQQFSPQPPDIARKAARIRKRLAS